MKIKFNRNVKHNHRYYEAGKVYEFDGEMTPELQSLLDITHVDVDTQKSTEDIETREEVKVAEVAPKDAPAEPQPPVVEKAK